MIRANVRDGLATSLFGWYLWLMTIWLANAVCQLGEVDMLPAGYMGMLPYLAYANGLE